MSGVHSEDIALLAKQAIVDVCWSQWVGMRSLALPAGSRRAQAIIDPEALILLSLYAGKEERRLFDLVAWWAQAGSRLTSLQRLRAVATRFPGETGASGLGLFATLAAEAGDRRWGKYATTLPPNQVRRGKGPDEPILVEACALWPRLRAGFGVGAKPDTLVFLLGLRGAWASAKVISFATGYSSVAIRKAAREMALAHLIRGTEGRPTEYVAPAGPWAELLELHPTEGQREAKAEAPGWRFWSEIFAFLVGVVEWSQMGHSTIHPGPHVIASRARDLIERHTRAFTFNGIATPPSDAFPGLEAVKGLEETVRVVTAWMDEKV